MKWSLVKALLIELVIRKSWLKLLSVIFDSKVVHAIVYLIREVCDTPLLELLSELDKYFSWLVFERNRI